METMVFCRFRFEAFHCWPEAPEIHSFLRVLHRHEFHVEVRKRVDGPDRAIEFIWLKGFCKRHVENKTRDSATKSWSCEHWAKWILDTIDADQVEVSEDGENGAIVTRE